MSYEMLVKIHPDDSDVIELYSIDKDNNRLVFGVVHIDFLDYSNEDQAIQDEIGTALQDGQALRLLIDTDDIMAMLKDGE